MDPLSVKSSQTDGLIKHSQKYTEWLLYLYQWLYHGSNHQLAVSGMMDVHNHEPPRDGGPREAAHYIAGAVAELALMARRHDLGMLGYLLDMAHLEAEQQVKPGTGR